MKWIRREVNVSRLSLVRKLWMKEWNILYFTTYALISFTENSMKYLDAGHFPCGIFADLQKAFDTVEHDILLTKLEHYGARKLADDSLKSYLSDRKQFVSINNYDSNLASVLYGVRQGSVLGPLLFLIYISELNQADSAKYLGIRNDENLNWKHHVNDIAKKLNRENALLFYDQEFCQC